MSQAIARGAAWMVLFKLTERSLGIISVLILARLLVPTDFGLVAMAMSVIAIVELASAFSFDIALIQRERLSREHYDTAWTMNVAFGLACAALASGLAYPAAALYSEPRITTIIQMLAASWIVQSFENIGVVDFRRDMNFSREFMFLALKKVVAFLVTVSLALFLRNYWALVAGIAVSRVTGVVLSYTMQPYRPRFSLAARRDLFSFSAGLLVNNALSVVILRLSHFVIGRLHGPAALGLYTVGWEIAHLPATELIAPINRAVFPGYARMAVDREKLRQGFLDVQAMIAVFALPASFGVAILADPLVRTLLGVKWIEAVVVVQILAFNGGLQAVTSNNFSAHLALGQTWVPPLMGAVKLASLIALIAILSPPLGILGVAYAEVGSTLLTQAVSYPILFRTLGLSSRAYIAGLWRSMVAAAGMAVIIAAAVDTLGRPDGDFPPVWQLLLNVFLGACLYSLSLLGLWLAARKPRGPEAYLVNRATDLMLRMKQAMQRTA